MNSRQPVDIPYSKPGVFARFFNNVWGFLVKLGIGLPSSFLLEVRGRKSGRTYSIPVNLLEYGGKKYLVAPRGDTQWVRNVAVSGCAVLKKGTRREEIKLSAIPDGEKPDILKSYLDSYKMTVQRFFPMPSGSPREAFEPFVSRYPVFEVTRSE